MLTTFFYLIVVPSILAFFLGYIAHGLKTMTKNSAGESTANLGSRSLEQNADPQKLEEAEENVTA
jgi:hypothetical protein